MNSDRTYYNVYLADAGSRVYQENRKNSLAKDHSKYSSTFLKSSLKQLLRRMTSHESIVSTHSFTHIVSATWEKGTNKRHNGLLREFIGESLKKLEFQDLKKYTDAINLRPRCILDYQSPSEAFHNELIQSRTAQKIVIGYETSTSTNKERKKYTRLQREQHNPKITASPHKRGSRSRDVLAESEYISEASSRSESIKIRSKY